MSEITAILLVTALVVSGLVLYRTRPGHAIVTVFYWLGTVLVVLGSLTWWAFHIYSFGRIFNAATSGTPVIFIVIKWLFPAAIGQVALLAAWIALGVILGKIISKVRHETFTLTDEVLRWTRRRERDSWRVHEFQKRVSSVRSQGIKEFIELSETTKAKRLEFIKELATNNEIIDEGEISCDFEDAAFEFLVLLHAKIFFNYAGPRYRLSRAHRRRWITLMVATARLENVAFQSIRFEWDKFKDLSEVAIYRDGIQDLRQMLWLSESVNKDWETHNILERFVSKQIQQIEEILAELFEDTYYLWSLADSRRKEQEEEERRRR